METHYKDEQYHGLKAEWFEDGTYGPGDEG